MARAPAEPANPKFILATTASTVDTHLKAFEDFMLATGAQMLITDYGKVKLGQPLFFPDAGTIEDQVGG